MLKLAQIKEYLRHGPYAWPGGYPIFFVATDGEALSFEAVRENWRDVVQAHICKGWSHSGWGIEACDINWEDEDLFCGHTGKQIECAYPTDGA